MGLTDWEPEFGDFLESVYKIYPRNLDVNSGNPLGASVCQISARNGRRTTSSGAYLSNAPSNLSVITDVTVEKIVFVHGKAVGVMTDGGKYCKTILSYQKRCAVASTPQSAQIKK